MAVTEIIDTDEYFGLEKPSKFVPGLTEHY